MNPSLPTFLIPTREQVQREEERQAFLKKFYSKGSRRRSPAEMRRHQAILSEQAIRKNLEHISDEKTMGETIRQLADALAEQGRFAEAAELATGEEQKEYQALAEAIERPDDELCSCKGPTVQTRNAQGAVTTQLPSEFVAGETFSPKHEAIVPIVKCAQCGQTNITPNAPVIDLAEVEVR